MRIVGSREGLGFGVDEGWHHPCEVIPWPQVEAVAAAVPAEVRQQLVAFRARWRDHQVAYPRFVASAESVGCGRIVLGQQLTPRQDAYVREHAAFEASGVLPAWEQKRAVLDAERLGLHAQALSLDARSEPGDLLELLDDQAPTIDSSPMAPADLAQAAPVPSLSTRRPALRPPSNSTPPAARAARPKTSSPIAPTPGGVGR